MNEALIIWLYTSLLTACEVLGVIALLVGIISLFLHLLYYLEDSPVAMEPFLITKNTWMCIFISFAILMNVVVPSKDDMKDIIGGSVLWNTTTSVLDSGEAKKLPSNILKAANTLLEEFNN